MTKEQRPFYLLANAIIVQACKDYMVMKEKEDLYEIESFIRSDWFSDLTEVDPELLLRFLNKRRNKKIIRRICIDYG